MQNFGIFSPVLGVREDYPSILIRNSFQPDNQDVRFVDGEVESAKKRVKEFIRSRYAITSVSLVDNTFSIDSDKSAEFTTGDTVVVISSTGNDNSYTVADVSVSGDTIITVTETIADGTVDGYLYNGLNCDSNLKVSTPDGNPIIKYFTHTASSGTEYVLAFTKSHIYRWDTALTRWQLMWTNTAECVNWSVDTINYGVVATNNVDIPLWWDGDTENVFVGLGDTTQGCEVSSGVYIVRAKAVKVYENYVNLGNVSLSDGSVYPSHRFFSDLQNPLAWMTGDAGYAQIVGDGDIQAFGTKHGVLYTFKSKSIIKEWFTGTEDIWNNEIYLERIGCIAPDSIVNDAKGNLYFFATDFTFKEIELNTISQARTKTVKAINPSSDYIQNIRSLYIVEYDEIRWAIPYSGSTINNKVLCYRDGVWTDIDMSVYAFGSYNRKSTWTWDTLPFDSWDSWGWKSWDNTEGSEGYPTDICSDVDGNTYALHLSTKDDEEDFTSYFVLSTDLTDNQALGLYKRILHIRPYFRNQGSGNMQIYIKRDNEPNWQLAGSVSMSDTNDIIVAHLATSFRARHFLVKFASTSSYSFIGVQFDYEMDGYR